MVSNQQGLPCGSIGTVTTRQKPVVDVFPACPHSIQIPPPCRQGQNTYEVILSDQPEQGTVLTRCGLPRSPRGLACHKVPGAACLQKMQFSVARVRFM